MTPAVRKAIETLRRAKAKLQFSDMLSAAQAFDLVSDALAGLEAEAAQETECDHAGWSFKKNGRCCPKCGVFVVDFGD